MIIAIDGPAASGKSTLAQAVAKRLGWLYLDTGAYYRALTLACQRSGADFANPVELATLACATDVRLTTEDETLRIYLGKDDVSLEIRGPAVSNAVAAVATVKAIRDHVTAMARRFAADHNVVTDGRDTTTVIFPDAEHKIFATASLAERARRRLGDFRRDHPNALQAEIEQDLAERDRRDRERSVGPLRQAPDAFFLDTTALGFEDAVNSVLTRVEQVPVSEE